MPDSVMQARARAVRLAPAASVFRTLVRGDAEAMGRALGVALPTAPCTATEGEPAALWLGPDEWLVLSQAAPALPEDGPEGVAFDVTDRQLGWRLEGEGAAAALAAGCPLDLAGLAEGGCTRTVFGKAEIVLWRLGAERFHLEVWRSFAPYVTGLLERSMRAMP